MPSSVGYSIQNEKEFLKALTFAFEKTGDLRVPFGIIRNDFYKDQKRIYLLKTRGQYPELSDEYKKRKIRMLGFAYPILRGANSVKNKPSLESSLTNMLDINAVNIISRTSLTLGTRVKYGIYHQSDKPRRKIPLRKFLFIDGKFVPKGGPGTGFGRVERWTSILADHVSKTVKEYNNGKS